MANNDFVPKICGDTALDLPDTNCTDCEQFELRLTALEECCEDVNTELEKKLEKGNILPGLHLYVERDEETNDVTIGADLTDYYNKQEVEHLMSQIGAYEEVNELPSEGDKNKIYLVPIQGGGYERWIYTDDGWKDLGSTQLTLDKASILNALGYRETTLSLIGENGAYIHVTVLVADV